MSLIELILSFENQALPLRETNCNEFVAMIKPHWNLPALQKFSVTKISVQKMGLLNFADDTKLREIPPTKPKRKPEVNIFLSGLKAVMKQKENKFTGCN